MTNLTDVDWSTIPAPEDDGAAAHLVGAVLPSLMDDLPNGDVLQHAFADFVVTANGVRLEGRGVIPDEEVTVTREDLLAGRDPTLDAAIEWIVRQR